jgi:nucleotide-binding universal stress UspA family protein
MFRKVLTATGIPGACEPALITALEIAKQNQGRLFILHVMEATYRHECGPQEAVKDFRTGEGVAPTHEYKEAVKEELNKKCGEALKPFGNYEINVVEGRPGVETRRWARKVGADLIVLGPHIERDEGNELDGSPRYNTVEEVIMYITSPVMIVNRFFQKERLHFKNIFVGVAFSKSCEYACQFAIRLARKYGSKVILFHMIPSQPSGYTKKELEQEIDASQERLKDFCKIPQGIEYEFLVWEGTQPSLEILKSASEKGADLIVMGSYTKETGEKPYIGSAVEQVSAKSSCPVAVVTHPDAVVKAGT